MVAESNGSGCVCGISQLLSGGLILLQNYSALFFDEIDYIRVLRNHDPLFL
jgi:hypothetical protein